MNGDENKEQYDRPLNTEELIEETAITEGIRARALRQVENISAELFREVHDHTEPEIPHEVKEKGGVMVSKQIALANLTPLEAELLKCDSVILRYMRFNELDPSLANVKDMVELSQLEAFSFAQITKGRDFTERKASVSQFIGTFRQAMQSDREQRGMLSGLKRRFGVGGVR